MGDVVNQCQLVPILPLEPNFRLYPYSNRVTGKKSLVFAKAEWRYTERRRLIPGGKSQFSG